MYVGACHQVCDVTINHAWMEYNALGYSGTNSGGAVVIENSQFDHNRTASTPTPRSTATRPHRRTATARTTASARSPTPTRAGCSCTTTCTTTTTPTSPRRAAPPPGPIGTGMTVSGGRNDTVMDNTFSNNGAWGILFVPYPDSGKPVARPDVHRTGGFEITRLRLRLRGRGRCPPGQHLRQQRVLRQPQQFRLRSDRAQHRPARELLRRQHRAERERASQPGADPAHLRRDHHRHQRRQRRSWARCCATPASATCPAGAIYPKATGVALIPLPAGLPTMPNPCRGVPANAWCPAGSGSSGSAGSSALRSQPGATSGTPGVTVTAQDLARGGPSRSRPPPETSERTRPAGVRSRNRSGDRSARRQLARRCVSGSLAAVTSLGMRVVRHTRDSQHAAFGRPCPQRNVYLTRNGEIISSQCYQRKG